MFISGSSCGVGIAGMGKWTEDRGRERKEKEMQKQERRNGFRFSIVLFCIYNIFKTNNNKKNS